MNVVLSKPKAYVYKRMSTLEQLKGDSSRRQLERAAQYAYARNLELEPIEDDGVSAFRGKNAIFGQLAFFIDRIGRGEIVPGSYLIVESLDRLSRDSISNAIQLFVEIVNAGIILVTLFDDREYSKASLEKEPLTIFLALISFATASEESIKKSERLSSAWDHKKRKTRDHNKPLSPIVPAWLTYDKKKDKIVINELRAAIVREIFELSIKGWGSNSIARLFNERKEPLWNPEKNKTKSWHESYIKKVLINRSTIGEFQPHKNIYIEAGKKRREPDGAPIYDYFPQIIDPITFERAQAAISLRRSKGAGRKGNGYSNLFSGLLHCGCGSGIRYINKGEGPHGGIYVRCLASYSGGPCFAKSIKYRNFERLLLENTLEVDFDRALGLEAANQKRDRLEHQLHDAQVLKTKTENSIKNLMQVILAGSKDTPEILATQVAMFQSQLDNCNSNISTLQSAIKELLDINPAKQKEIVERLISQLATHEGDALSKLRRHLAQDLKRVIKNITVYPELIPDYDNSQTSELEGIPQEIYEDRLFHDSALNQYRLPDEMDESEALHYRGNISGFRIVITYYSGITQILYSNGYKPLNLRSSNKDLIMRAKHR